jgi:hypothetical protein
MGLALSRGGDGCTPLAKHPGGSGNLWGATYSTLQVRSVVEWCQREKGDGGGVRSAMKRVIFLPKTQDGRR